MKFIEKVNEKKCLKKVHVRLKKVHEKVHVLISKRQYIEHLLNNHC